MRDLTTSLGHYESGSPPACRCEQAICLLVGAARFVNGGHTQQDAHPTTHFLCPTHVHSSKRELLLVFLLETSEMMNGTKWEYADVSQHEEVVCSAYDT